MKLLLFIIFLFLFITISFSINTNYENEDLDDDSSYLKTNNIFLSEKEDKSINEIINKGYKKLVENLKLKNQYHNNEKKYQKLALENQKLKPMGYKCKHDHIMNNHFSTIKELSNDNGNENNEVVVIGEKESLKLKDTTATTINPSAPIRFKIDTTYISGTTDKYACYNVGDKVNVSKTTVPSSQACKTDGSIDPCIYTCTSADLQTTAYQQFLITSIVETMVEIFESRLKIINPQSSFKFNSNSNAGTCGYGVQIPASYYTTGVSNVDMYVYVTSRPYSAQNTVAYASPCNFPVSGSLYGRPTAANINFCPSYFTGFVGKENSIDYNMFVRTGIHEMTHALGFSSNFYNSYVLPNTQTKIRNGAGAAASYLFSGVTPSGQSYSVTKSGIFSDKVVAFAKDHYGCDSITNVELEDDGDSGTAGSHWEMRTVGEEYMLGYISPVMPITSLTMSILEDSGWYEIDSSANEQLVYGKGLGCNFVQKMCTPQTWNYTGYFCSVNGQTGCTGTRAGKGRCTIQTTTSALPPLYQHFSNPTLIGVTATNDGCPFIRVENYNSYCFDTSKQSTANSAIFEEYTANSKCFEYKSSTSSAINQACWQQRCTNNTLQIKINSDWVNCPDSSTVVSNGITIVCPISYNICLNSSNSSSSSSSQNNTSSSIEDINNASTLLPSSLFIIILSILNYFF